MKKVIIGRETVYYFGWAYFGVRNSNVRHDNDPLSLHIRGCRKLRGVVVERLFQVESS